jgi:hypothetical protein
VPRGLTPPPGGGGGGGPSISDFFNFCLLENVKNSASISLILFAHHIILTAL